MCVFFGLQHMYGGSGLVLWYFLFQRVSSHGRGGGGSGGGDECSCFARARAKSESFFGLFFTRSCCWRGRRVVACGGTVPLVPAVDRVCRLPGVPRFSFFLSLYNRDALKYFFFFPCNPYFLFCSIFSSFLSLSQLSSGGTYSSRRSSPLPAYGACIFVLLRSCNH